MVIIIRMANSYIIVDLGPFEILFDFAERNERENTRW